MLTKKERMVWILAILIAIMSTFFITSKLTTTSQNTNGDVPTKVFTDIEQEANHWFTSNDSLIPRRDVFTQWDNIDAPLQIYQGYIEQGAPWVNYPEQIALRVFYPPPEVEGFVPDKVNIYFHNADIAIVTIIVTSQSGANERRFDFVRVDNIWKIVWLGERSISLQ